MKKPAPEVVIVDDDVDVPEIQIKDESTKQEKRASIVRELSPDRIGDFEDDEDQYESVPAYEAPHKRDEESSKKSSRSSRKRKKGVQYPDPEFDRRWERKRREEEDLKQRYSISKIGFTRPLLLRFTRFSPIRAPKISSNAKVKAK
jgi:hypothetical protein